MMARLDSTGCAPLRRENGVAAGLWKLVDLPHYAFAPSHPGRLARPAVAGFLYRSACGWRAFSGPLQRWRDNRQHVQMPHIGERLAAGLEIDESECAIRQ
jgi:hypothetical protein